MIGGQSIDKNAVNATLLLNDDDFFNLVPRPDGVDDVGTFVHLAEYRMVAIQVLGILPIVADEELGATGIAASMGHGQYPTVVALADTGQLAIDFVAGASTASAFGASTLNHKIGNDPVEVQTIVKAIFRKFYKVGDGAGSIVIKKDGFHLAFCSMDLCYFHSFVFDVKRQR